MSRIITVFATILVLTLLNFTRLTSTTSIPTPSPSPPAKTPPNSSPTYSPTPPPNPKKDDVIITSTGVLGSGLKTFYFANISGVYQGYNTNTNSLNQSYVLFELFEEALLVDIPRKVDYTIPQEVLNSSAMRIVDLSIASNSNRRKLFQSITLTAKLSTSPSSVFEATIENKNLRLRSHSMIDEDKGDSASAPYLTYDTSSNTLGEKDNSRYKMYSLVANISSLIVETTQVTDYNKTSNSTGIFFLDKFEEVLNNGEFQAIMRNKSTYTSGIYICSDNTKQKCANLFGTAASTYDPLNAACARYSSYVDHYWSLYDNTQGKIGGFYGFLIILLLLWSGLTIFCIICIQRLGYAAKFSLWECCCACSATSDGENYRARDRILAERAMVRVCYINLATAISKILAIVYLLKTTLINELSTFSCVKFSDIFYPEEAQAAGIYSPVYVIFTCIYSPLLLLAVIYRYEWMHVLMRSIGLMHTGQRRGILAVVSSVASLLKVVAVALIVTLMVVLIAFLAARNPSDSSVREISNAVFWINVLMGFAIIFLVAMHLVSLTGVYTEVDLALTTESALDSKTKPVRNGLASSDAHEGNLDDSLSTTSIIKEKLKRQLHRYKSAPLAEREANSKDKEQSQSASRPNESNSGTAANNDPANEKNNLNRIVTDLHFSACALVQGILIVAYAFPGSLSGSPVTTFMFESLLSSLLAVLLAYFVLSRFQVKKTNLNLIVYNALGDVECQNRQREAVDVRNVVESRPDHRNPARDVESPSHPVAPMEFKERERRRKNSEDMNNSSSRVRQSDQNTLSSLSMSGLSSLGKQSTGRPSSFPVFSHSASMPPMPIAPRTSLPVSPASSAGHHSRQVKESKGSDSSTGGFDGGSESSEVKRPASTASSSLEMGKRKFTYQCAKNSSNSSCEGIVPLADLHNSANFVTNPPNNKPQKN